MSKAGDIDHDHQAFLEKMREKRERAERLRDLFNRGKSIFQSTDKTVQKSPEIKAITPPEQEKSVSPFIQQQQTKYAPSIGNLSPSPTPPTSVTAKNKQEKLNEFLNYRSFEKSMYPGRSR